MTENGSILPPFCLSDWAEQGYSDDSDKRPNGFDLPAVSQTAQG